jgi:hypothetical protein
LKAFQRLQALVLALVAVQAVVFRPSRSRLRASRAQPSLLFTKMKACLMPRS